MSSAHHLPICSTLFVVRANEEAACAKRLLSYMRVIHTFFGMKKMYDATVAAVDHSQKGEKGMGTSDLDVFRTGIARSSSDNTDAAQQGVSHLSDVHSSPHWIVREPPKKPHDPPDDRQLKLL